MTMSQMNVRINDAVRIEGNAAFESIGWTPSQAAREVWAYAARNRRSLRKLRELQDFIECEKKENVRVSEADEGARLVSEGLAGLGIDITKHAPTPLEDLKRDAYAERWRERGLL